MTKEEAIKIVHEHCRGCSVDEHLTVPEAMGSLTFLFKYIVPRIVFYEEEQFEAGIPGMVVFSPTQNGFTCSISPTIDWGYPCSGDGNTYAEALLIACAKYFAGLPRLQEPSGG